MSSPVRVGRTPGGPRGLRLERRCAAGQALAVEESRAPPGPRDHHRGSGLLVVGLICQQGELAAEQCAHGAAQSSDDEDLVCWVAEESCEPLRRNSDEEAWTARSRPLDGRPGVIPAAHHRIDGSYHTPEQKALEAYARGMKLKRKAEGEKDPAKQTKLYLKAKEELSKSVGYHGHYDGYLALGQVYLALGEKDSAFDSCSRAQAMKPNDETAKSCVEQARP